MMIINEKHLNNRDKEDNDELYKTPEKVKIIQNILLMCFFNRK